MNTKNKLIYSKAKRVCLELSGYSSDLSFFSQLKMVIREKELWG